MSSIDLLSNQVNAAICYIHDNRPDIYFTEQNINVRDVFLNNILFKIKKESLKEDSVLIDIPFYWDKQGPKSDIVSIIIQNQELSNVCLKSEADVRTLKLVLNRIQSTDICTYVKQIFQLYAPNKYMYIFSRGFLQGLKNVTECQSTQDLSQLKYLAYRSIISVPRTPPFSWFNEIFSGFIATSVRVLDYCKHYQMDLSLLKEVYDIGINDIWDTFVKGFRILRSGHDTYYIGKLKEWYREYLFQVECLEPKIDKFKFRVLEEIRYDYLPCNMSEGQQQIVSTILNSYLSNE